MSQKDPTAKTAIHLAKTTKKLNWPLYLIFALSISIGVVASQFLTMQQALVSGALFFCISSWATSILPAFWPALALFAFATATQIAPSQVIFSGFHSSTFWLLFSGMVFGAAIVHTGLNSRVTYLLSRILGNSYRGTIIKLALCSMVLAFFIPSAIGRVVLIIPIVASLADHFGYTQESNGRKGMLLSAAFGTFLPTFSILPANAPNMLLSGMAEALYNTPLSYWEYLSLHFPVLGLGKLLAVILAVLWLFPDTDPISSKIETKTETQGLKKTEKRLLFILCVCFAFWFTDSIHHISAGWIGLAAATICLLPKLGLTDKACIDKGIQYSTLVFSAGIIGLSAIIGYSGLGEILVNYLTTVVPFSPDSPILNLGLLTFISTCVALVVNLPGVPALMTPMTEHLVEITGLSFDAVLMSQVMAFSNPLFPYQTAPLITAIAIGNISIKAVTKVCIATFLFSSFILIPINFLWWHILSVF